MFYITRLMVNHLLSHQNGHIRNIHNYYNVTFQKLQSCLYSMYVLLKCLCMYIYVHEFTIVYFANNYNP